MSDLIGRAPGDDIIVPVRMRLSSFEKLISTDDGHSVPVSEGMIGLIPSKPDDEHGNTVWTFVVWTFVVWSGAER
jgi:hypothetical protein